MKKIILSLALLTTLSLQATEMNISVELPEQQYEGRFYPPFVTAWVEKDKEMVGTLFLWHHKQQNEINEEWVKGLKKWWRRGGKDADLTNFDAVAGATKKPGTHVETLDAKNTTLSKLEKGTEYKLVIEANREKGDNEAVEVLFTLNDDAQELKLKGKKELGEITVNVKP